MQAFDVATLLSMPKNNALSIRKDLIEAERREAAVNLARDRPEDPFQAIRRIEALDTLNRHTALTDNVTQEIDD